MGSVKLKFKEIFFIIILSLPLGSTLYFINYKKINYEIKLKPGFAIATKFCGNLNFYKENLYTQHELYNIINNSELDSRKYTLRPSGDQMYTISAKSEIGQDKKFDEEIKILKQNIILLESRNFVENFQKIELTCENNLKYQVFERKPSFLTVNNFKKSYTSFHLVLLLLTPTVILLLLFVSLKYIKLVSMTDDK